MVLPSGTQFPMPKPYGGNPPTITSEPKGEGKNGVHVTVQLVGEIGPITQYLELLDVLDNATEDDEVEIKIDTPGGDVYTTMLIVERMENCRGHVITTASGLVASAGSFLWFFGKERRVNRWAKFLIHCSSHGDMGRSLSILETSQKLVAYMKELGLLMLGAGLIDHAEFAAAFENKSDVELTAATVRARLGIGVKAQTEPVVPVEPQEPVAPPTEPTTPATPQTPVEPTTPPATPTEPTTTPTEPTTPPTEPTTPPVTPTAPENKTGTCAKCGQPKGKCKCKKAVKMIRRVVRAEDGTTQIVEEPAPEPTPTEPTTPVTPTEPTPPTEPTTPPTEPTTPPTEPTTPPTEPTTTPTEPTEPQTTEDPVLDIAKIFADEGIDLPPVEPEPTVTPTEPVPPTEPVTTPVTPATPATPTEPVARS